MRIRFLLSGVLFSVSAWCLAVPKILIVQINNDPTSNQSPIPLGDALAQALSEEGKSEPIFWSQTDPVFRDATLDGRVPSIQNPGPDDVQAAEKALACDYVVLVQVQVKGTALTGRADMYKDAKQVYSDSETIDPRRSSTNDLNNAVLSAARTWAIQIGSGPLKTIQAQPKPPEAPAPSQGQIPKSPSVDPVPTVTDSAKAIDDYQKLMAAKQITEATNLLRQAVDNSPLDEKLRILLIQHLTQIGRSREAAEEAQRASLLIPDSAELRQLAARAYIDSGQTDQAEAQLNEQLARNPDDPGTRAMLADIDLAGMKIQPALDNINAAIKKAPSKDLVYRKALCDSIDGDATDLQADLTQAGQVTVWNHPEEESYGLCMKVFGASTDQWVGDLRSLNQRAAVKRDDPDVAKEIDEDLAMLQARQTFVDGWPPPETHKKSQGKLSLALKLLSQSLSELKAYLSDGSQDTLTDASIDLGESIKQLQSARDALATEQGSVARDGSTTVYSDH